MTSWLMLVVFLVTFAVMVVLSRLPVLRQRQGLGGRAARLLLTAFAVLFLAAVALNESVSRALGRNPGFSGRTNYWAANFSGVMDRPFLGWGGWPLGGPTSSE